MKKHAFSPQNPKRVSNGLFKRNPLKTLRVSWVPSNPLKPEKNILVFQRVSRFQGFTPLRGWMWRVDALPHHLPGGAA